MTAVNTTFIPETLGRSYVSLFAQEDGSITPCFHPIIAWRVEDYQDGGKLYTNLVRAVYAPCNEPLEKGIMCGADSFVMFWPDGSLTEHGARFASMDDFMAWIAEADEE